MIPLLLAACGGPDGHPGREPEPEPGSSVEVDVRSPERPANVLLVLLDDVGIEKFGLYGGRRPPATPTIDGLASRGVLFERAYARPMCVPSRASLQTGRYGRRTGAAINWPQREPWELPLSQVALPELVGGALGPRYETAIVGKWHLAGLGSPSGYLHPLLTGWGWHSGSFANLYEGFQPRSYYDWDRVENGELAPETVYATTSTVDDAIERVRAMPEPWMLMVSFNAAHKPVEPPPPELVPTPSREPYATIKDMIAAADTELGRLLDEIGEERLDRTHVLLMADNGTDADYVENPSRAKASLFEQAVRVPFIVAGPAVREPGTRSAAFVDLVDVWPTVAELVSGDPSAGEAVAGPDPRYRVDGISLVPYLEDPGRPSLREFAYNELAGPPGPGPYVDYDKQSIRDERYKLIRDNLGGREMLFELVDDREGSDLLACGLTTAEQRAELERLRAELDRVTADLVFEGSVEPYSPVDEGWMPYDLPHDTAAPQCGDP